MVLAIICLALLLIGSQIANHKQTEKIVFLESENLQYQERIKELVLEREEKESGLSLEKVKFKIINS